MENLRRRALPVLLALPLAFAACGGSSDEDKIRAIVKDGDKDPQTICDNASKALLDQIGGKDKCAEAAKSAPKDDKTTVNSVKVDGDKATAEVTAKKGKDTIKFVKEDGDWKVAAQ